MGPFKTEKDLQEFKSEGPGPSLYNQKFETLKKL
jgi:hypothetical protein